MTAAIACAAWIGGAAPASAEVHITRNVTTYAVHGTSAKRLVKQMNRLGPVDPNDGSRWWGEARWVIDLDYEFQNDSQGCRFTSIRIDLQIEVTLPEWIDRESAPAKLRASWDRMIAALRRHENKHAQHGTDAAHEIDTRLGQMGARPNCAQLERDARVIANAIVHKHGMRDVMYDERTRHGETEIPPLSDR